MKEYNVQMKQDGKWKKGHAPQRVNGYSSFSTRERAEEYMSYVVNSWEKWEERQKMYGDSDACTKSVPTEFRLVVREVTDWEEA